MFCETQDALVDNQLSQAAWTVAFCSPLHTGPPLTVGKTQMSAVVRRKPFFELTIDVEYPHVKNRIGYFRHIYFAPQMIREIHLRVHSLRFSDSRVSY